MQNTKTLIDNWINNKIGNHEAIDLNITNKILANQQKRDRNI